MFNSIRVLKLLTIINNLLTGLYSLVRSRCPVGDVVCIEITANL